MTASAYLFAEDLLDEGLSSVVERLRSASLDSAIMAATYHHSRDIFPHGVHRKLQYLEGGVCYFQPDRARYGRIQPVVASIIGAGNPLVDLTQLMPTSAWLVTLHNSRLAEAYPDCAPVNAFGDRLLDGLCPAHPEVREFVVALASDVARFDLQSIKLEAVQYMGYDHGGHHERSFVPLSPTIRFLLGLCFCQHCRAAASTNSPTSSERGEEATNLSTASSPRRFDPDTLQALVRDRISAVFDSVSAESSEADVDDEAMQALLGQYAIARQHVITSLVQDIAAAVHQQSPTTRVTYLDPSGASLGYATGRPTSERTATSVGWRDGIDLPAIAEHVDGIGLLGYFAEPDRFERELNAYLRTTSADRLEVILRPMAPDTTSAAALAQKVKFMRAKGIGEISFYHYGFMRLENLDWIRAALTA